MPNKRIYYAVQRAGIGVVDEINVLTVRGLQTIGITTTFNLEQVFEIGQLAIYENIEGIPDVEVQTEKVLDGYSPVYLLATQQQSDGTDTAATTLPGRADTLCRMAIAIYDEASPYAETGTGASASAPISEVHMSGLYVSSVGYSVGVDGNATETCTLVGNNKVWVLGGDTGNFVGYDLTAANWVDDPWSAGTTNPKSITGSGGVNRREDVLLGSGTTAHECSLLPLNIPGISNGGNCSGLNMLVGGEYGAHIQTWSVNVDLGREELFELGRLGTYYRYVNFPVEVTNEITVISGSGDLVSATENGIYAINDDGSCGDRYNLVDQCIKLVMCEGLIVDCGTVNKLSSVGVSGGDSGGGNMEVTYSYTNFNDFDVKHPSDPVAALQP